MRGLIDNANYRIGTGKNKTLNGETMISELIQNQESNTVNATGVFGNKNSNKEKDPGSVKNDSVNQIVNLTDTSHKFSDAASLASCRRVGYGIY